MQQPFLSKNLFPSVSLNVPQSYLGTWRRTLLEQGDTQDTTTVVLWVQTEKYHADIRIPLSRPAFGVVNQLKEYSYDQLISLASQQGFTGITQVKNNIAEWLRDHDYQPSNSQRDIAEMHFENDDVLIEKGVEADYFERWERIPNSHLNLSMMECEGKDRHANKVNARLFRSNNLFAYVRPRSKRLPPAENISDLIDFYQPSKEELLDWLDFEISFGEIKDENEGYITHSTFPFREGETVKLNEP